MKKFIFFLSLLMFSYTTFSQKWYKKARAYTGVGLVVGSDSLAPFLIRSNQYGTLLNTSNSLYFNSGIKKQYDSLYTLNKKLKKFDYGYGIEGHVNIGRTQDFRLPEAYAKIRYGIFELYGGRRREIQGLVDTLGTMGSYIWSGNALPLPKLEVSIANYTPIIGRGLISIKGNFAHGWFGDADSVKNYWLHQKSFYARVGRPSWKVKFYGGFNHQVQWGGRPAKPFYDPISNQTISKFGSDFATFVKVATGVSLASGANDWTNQTGVAANEAGNRSGNHLGTVDVGMEIYLAKAKIFIYRQSIYEDGSLYYLTNISDGLNGVSIKLNDSKIFKKICVEYLNTTSQGGNLFSDVVSELRGVDNYFNNSLYKDAWTYKGMVLGSPFMQTKNNYYKRIGLNYVDLSKNMFFNNRVRVFKIGFDYQLSNSIFISKIYFTENNGSFLTPLRFLNNQVSFSQRIQFDLFKNIVSINIASDLNNNLFKNNIGANLSVKKVF
ncbi:capsule assembly Wzi family protein [Lacihabitans lacunae]|uniref:Capsule assembly Wzi family protein n=1 Tax=Lacihabitans lacunae TaxID=1028214 RepID=A0ABV7YZJ2_9BACT